MSQQPSTRLFGSIELVSADISCWKCGKQTPVHALQVANIEEFEPNEEPDRLEAATFVYELSPSSLPAAVKAELASRAPNYKPLFSKTVGEVSWANACVHCGLVQGAFFLHHKPDGPFFGGPEDFAGPRTLLATTGFDVDGASYSR